MIKFLDWFLQGFGYHIVKEDEFKKIEHFELTLLLAGATTCAYVHEIDYIIEHNNIPCNPDTKKYYTNNIVDFKV